MEVLHLRVRLSSKEFEGQCPGRNEAGSGLVPGESESVSHIGLVRRN